METKLPDILYHGTTKEFHDAQVDAYGVYKGELGPFCLTTSLIEAWAFAKSNAVGYQATPAILVINTAKSRNITGPEFALSCESLESGCYKVFEFESSDYWLDDKFKEKMNGLEREVINLS
tara:strand:- start:1973 stop:2335 length:363 start_codon:yes stop_codon:yes gene_type:complete